MGLLNLSVIFRYVINFIRIVQSLNLVDSLLLFFDFCLVLICFPLHCDCFFESLFFRHHNLWYLFIICIYLRVS